MASAPKPLPDREAAAELSDSLRVLNNEIVSHITQLNARLERTTGLVIGLSGGLDSSLLLTLCRNLRERGDLLLPLRAIHVDHGIHAESQDWRRHCESLCAELGVELTCFEAELADSPGGEVSEEAARHARYAYFEQALAPGECLLLAHHLDDQLETLLLRLLRGAGVEGLAGMPLTRELGDGLLLRPLLDFPRAKLELAADTLGLKYVADPSNADTQYDRNLLRNSVLPLLEGRWPQYRQSCAKSLQLMAESDELNKALADLDIQACRVGSTGRLNLHCVAEYTAARRRNLLRRWLRELGLPTAGWNLLDRLEREVIANPGHPAHWKHGDFTVYRERGDLVAVRNIDYDRCVNASHLWSPSEQHRIELPGNGSIEVTFASKSVMEDFASDNNTPQFLVAYRQGGESIKLPGRVNKSLKKWLNESHVAPWLRDRLPLLFLDGELVWVAELGPSETFASRIAETTVRLPGEVANVTFRWHPPALELTQ